MKRSFFYYLKGRLQTKEMIIVCINAQLKTLKWKFCASVILCFKVCCQFQDEFRRKKVGAGCGTQCSHCTLQTHIWYSSLCTDWSVGQTKYVLQQNRNRAFLAAYSHYFIFYSGYMYMMCISRSFLQHMLPGKFSTSLDLIWEIIT